MRSHFASVVLAVLLASCGNSVVVELQTGAQSFDLSTAGLGLPSQLRDASSGAARVATIDCSMTGICPPATGDLVIACTAGVCDPAALDLTVPVGDVVDFDQLLSSAGSLLRFVDAIEITAVDYQVSPNTLTVDLPPVTVLWGPESAVATSTSLGAIGTMPALAAATPATGQMDIDQNGSAALSDYLVHTSRRVRFFARTAVDLAPGGPFPDGMATMTVNIHVRAVGHIVN